MQPADEENKTNESGNDVGHDNRIKVKSLLFKIIFIIIIFAVAFSLLYYYSLRGNVVFVLANNEIVSEDMKPDTTFAVQDKIYFFIKRPGTSINADLFVLEIGRIEGDKYSHNMQISYELGKNCSHLSAYIPQVYTRTPGVYRITALLDGKKIAVKDITIVK